MTTTLAFAARCSARMYGHLPSRRQVDLSATLNSIVQAEELGVSIAQLLRIQGDTQRAKRFAMAEKQANEAPVKIIIPVVLFILPAVFIILMGPLIKMTLDQMR